MAPPTAEPTAPPRVSVCVSTRNRAHLLPGLVEHLQAQTLPPAQFEVVVVDDGSTDDTWAVLTSLAETAGITLRHLRHDRARGAAAGRNTAWRAARAPLVAFTDDDCLPTPEWLAAVVEQVPVDVAVVAAGAVLPPSRDEARTGAFARVVAAVPHTAAWCATANLAVRREDLERVGGLDEVCLPRAAEDTDLALRLQAAGATYRFVPGALVHHPVEPGGFRATLRDQRRYVDLPRVFATSPWARRQLLHHGMFWRRTHPLALAAALGLPLLRRRPAVALALAAPWLHERLCRQPVNGIETMAERLMTLPAVLALDLHEVAVMAAGSVKHRTVVL